MFRDGIRGLSKVNIVRSIGGSFSFDATVLERHGSKLTITDNPVETGAVVSDHAYLEPATLEVHGRVSSVVTRLQGGGGTAQAVLATLAPKLKHNIGIGWVDQHRPASAFDLLQRLQQARVPFTIQTGLKLYRNMLLEDLQVSQETANKSAPEFFCTFREVKLVSTQTTKMQATSTDRTAYKSTPDKRTKDGKTAGGKPDKVVAKRKVLEQKTADRAEPTVKRGDSGKPATPAAKTSETTVNRSILKSMF